MVRFTFWKVPTGGGVEGGRGVDGGGGGLWERAPTAPGDGLNWGERRDGDICMEPRGRRSWALASFSSQFKSGYPCFTNGNSGQTSNSPRWSACTMRMGGLPFSRISGQ